MGKKDESRSSSLILAWLKTVPKCNWHEKVIWRGIKSLIQWEKRNSSGQGERESRFLTDPRLESPQFLFPFFHFELDSLFSPSPREKGPSFFSFIFFNLHNFQAVWTQVGRNLRRKSKNSSFLPHPSHYLSAFDFLHLGKYFLMLLPFFFLFSLIFAPTTSKSFSDYFQFRQKSEKTRLPSVFWREREWQPSYILRRENLKMEVGDEDEMNKASVHSQKWLWRLFSGQTSRAGLNFICILEIRSIWGKLSSTTTSTRGVFPYYIARGVGREMSFGVRRGK